MSASTDSPTFTRHQVAILTLLMGAGFLLSADFSILNVAVPSIGEGVGLGLSQLPWITTAFALPAAGFTLLFGRLADLVGRRKLFMTAMVVLIAASLLGGLTSSPEVLLAARALQGLSTAMAIPASMSLLTTTFEEGKLRERALGLNGALLSGGFTFGALAGGTLVSAFSWRAAFLVNVPVALAILVATPLMLRESSTPENVKLDLPGAVTVTAGLLAGIYGVLEQQWAVVGLGVALLAAFWIIELKVEQPLAPVRILRRPTVKWGNYAGLVIFMMLTGMVFLMTIYLQQVVGLSPVVTGLVLGLPGLVAVAAGIVAGSLIGKVGNVRLLTISMAVQGLAILPLAFLGTTPSILYVVVPCLVVAFFAHVSAIVSFIVTGTSGLPNEEQGLATGLTSMTQQVAITVGTPILVAVATTQATEAVGVQFALRVDVAFTLLSALVVGIGLTSRARQEEPVADGVHAGV